MRILIIRHGDPDYKNDSLTELGRKEAELVSKRFHYEPLTAIYCSTKGRAVETCRPTAEDHGMEPVYCSWLQEVPFPIEIPGYRQQMFNFSLPPRAWNFEPAMESVQNWHEAPFYSRTEGMREYMDQVYARFDGLLSSYGWSRWNHCYFAARDARDVCLAFFCHQGLGTALIAHMCGLPLGMLWNTSMMPTSSISTVVMDHHQPDEPIWVPRLLQMGDTGHIYAAGMPVNWRGLHHSITP